MKNKIADYTLEQEPIVLSKQLFDYLLAQENPADLIALYTFYYYTAKWQKTNQPRATTAYGSNALGWGIAKFRKVKMALISLNLISDVSIRNEAGNQFTGHYVHVHFIWGASKFSELEESGDAYTGVNSPAVRNRQRCVDSDANALRANNINALRANKDSSAEMENNELSPTNLLGTPITPNMFDKFWRLYPKKVAKGSALTAWNKLCRNKNRPFFTTIRSAILGQLESERWQEPDFIPYPATWLNQSRWLDDPATMTAHKRTNGKHNVIGHFESNYQYRKDDAVI